MLIIGGGAFAYTLSEVGKFTNFFFLKYISTTTTKKANIIVKLRDNSIKFNREMA
jgi:hypothetical protein